MPVLGSSAYGTCTDVLDRIRVMLNDSEVQGGDVLTDTAPFTFVILNSAYERVQIELANAGVEVQKKDWWLTPLPVMPTIDPEARLVIDDTGCNVLYPNGTGNILSLVPQLPPDLVLPTRLWERQTATTLRAKPMRQALRGLESFGQSSRLGDWQWESEQLRFRGALVSQDVKIEGEKSLPKLVAPGDPVPIRAVTNAAAYFGALLFTQSRGGEVSEAYKTEAEEEIMLYKGISARRRQHIQSRRRGYSASCRSGSSSTNTS